LRGLPLVCEKNVILTVRVRFIKPLWVLGFVAFALCFYLLAASRIAGFASRHKVVHAVAAAFNNA
jgi:hypothetical protein